VNGKMRAIKTFPAMGGGRIKENKYAIFDTL
jgi:hypothetical protein